VVGNIARRFPVLVTAAADAASALVDEIDVLARARAKEGRRLVVGLPTGRTPIALYAQWVRRVRDGHETLRNLVTFNLDEFVGVDADHPASCRAYMQRHLFAPIGLSRDDKHFPEPGRCEAYEAAIVDAGGIDLQIVGIGRNGHVGFNEPGSTRASRTREVELARATREDAAAAFGGLDRVPTHGVTAGIATILAARRIRVLAFGAAKSAIVRGARAAPASAELPITWLRDHDDVQLIIDRDAAGDG
jgi:glucosamine-6-phosphate deaminase